MSLRSSLRLCGLLVVAACGGVDVVNGVPRASDGGEPGDAGALPPSDAEPADAVAEVGSGDAQPRDAGAPWTPRQTDRFLYQLGATTPDTSACVAPFGGGACVRPTVWAFDLYAADGKTPNRAGVAAVHAVGGHAVCYVSGGSLERYRPDAAAFPAGVLGKVMDGWPDERWLDVAQLGVLEPLMRARAQRCKDAGFDAIDWDNVDGYANDNGVGLTATHQLAYNRLLARIAHELGLAVGLKNDLEQIPALVTAFDFAVNMRASRRRAACLCQPTAGRAA